MSWSVNALAMIGGNLPTGAMGIVYQSAAFALLGYVGLALTAQAFWRKVA